MSPTRSLAVAASSFVLVLAGCSASTSASKPDRSTTSSITTASSATTGAEDSSESSLPADTSGAGRVAETSESRALAKKLVSSIDGYEIQPDSVGDTGPSDLDKTVDDTGGGNEIRTQLTVDDFVVGYQRYFAKSSGDRDIVVFAYQFGDPAGAKNFVATIIEIALEPKGGVTPKPLSAPDIPDAKGFQQTSDGVMSQTVMYAKGDYVAMVMTNAPEGDSSSSTVLDIAKQQYDLL